MEIMNPKTHAAYKTKQRTQRKRKQKRRRERKNWMKNKDRWTNDWKWSSNCVPNVESHSLYPFIGVQCEGRYSYYTMSHIACAYIKMEVNKLRVCVCGRETESFVFGEQLIK